VLLHIERAAGPWPLEWPMWLNAVGLADLQPVRSMHFSQYDQLIGAALGGQGVALGRSPIVDALLAEGRLVAPFTERLDTARAYYVVQSQAAHGKPEVQAFVRWLLEEAAGAA
jgi:LysR family transcriptional regulator, glycine cleavage system transcriptional activator